MGKKKRESFFSRLLSSLFFRSDWIRTKKKRKFIWRTRLQPLIRAEKKEEIEEKKERKKFLRSLAAFLYRREEEKKKSSQRTHIHTHTQAFSVFYYHNSTK
jgi:ribosomal protein L17